MSQLRTWLRQERAREHHRTLYGRLFAVNCTASEIGTRPVVPAFYDPIMREPTANKHIHGRDCDDSRTEVAGCWPRHWIRFHGTCGVKGEWR